MVGSSAETNTDNKAAVPEDYSVFDVAVEPAKGKRLGLWLMGGKDQGFPPVVESIQQGSPASDATLEVGDQIWYVGDVEVSGLPHDEVADLIYKAGIKGTISLRIKRRKIEFDLQPYNSDDEDSGIVDNNLYKHITELNSLNEKVKSPSDKLDNSPEPLNMRESSATETYISHSTFKPDVGVKQHTVSKHDANGKTAAPLIDNGAYLNGAFSPVEMDNNVHEMAVDCPVDFEGTPKTKPKMPAVHAQAVTQKEMPPSTNGRPFAGTAGSGRTRNEVVRYHQEEEIKRHEEEIKLTREQQFLRASLRESQKLKSLQAKQRARQEPQSQAPPSAAFVNEGFESGDDRDRQSPASRGPLGPNEVEHCLEVIDQKLGHAGGEVVGLLRSIRRRFEDERFKQILEVHKAVVESRVAVGTSSSSVDTTTVRLDPTTTNAVQLVRDVAEAVDELSVNPPAKQLHALLTTEAHIAALIETHDELAKLQNHEKPSQVDAVANELRHPVVSTSDVSPYIAPPLSAEDNEFILRKQAQYNESGLKLVRFDRDSDAPLGATIHNIYESVLIARVVKGSLIEKSGLLHSGDELLEVNGIEMRGKNVNDVWQVLSDLTGAVTMLVLPNSESEQLLQQQHEQPIEEDLVHLRALFSYEPEEDRLCPCRELGITFGRGEILHVVNAADACWWQASREGEEDQMPGIIPSKKFWEMREMKRIELETEMFADEQRQQTCCPGFAKKKLPLESQEILSYEDVGQYYPQPQRKRPIVLIGPQHVGRHELRRLLLESDPDRFAPAIPHTTKTRETAEINGRDYHFVDKRMFQTLDKQSQFIECGMYQGNLYGTSLRAVADVISSGRVCILNLNPESIERVRRPELKPYIIFIAPPPLAQLQQLTNKLGQKLPDEKLTEIIEAGRATDVKWGHLFDFVVVNQDFDRTYKLITDEINRLDVEPQWVPWTWLAHPLGANGTSGIGHETTSFSSARGSATARERAINASPIASRA